MNIKRIRQMFGSAMGSEVRMWAQWGFWAFAALLIATFILVSNGLVKSLEQEEHIKMSLWADAYRKLLSSGEDEDMTLVLEVIDGNKTIPVFYTESDGTLLGYNNLDIPKDTVAYINSKRAELMARGNVFEIDLGQGWIQYLYYDESILLQQLHYYPYIQIAVIIIFVMLLYAMISSRKQAEQDRVWVGLSKETAHQLGTPISSLMAWVDYLKEADLEPEIVQEMDKDVQRLHVVAERFSKIGSLPKMTDVELVSLVDGVAQYMQKRASSRILIATELPDHEVHMELCEALFSWVIENLCRNAIDAISGDGKILVRLIDYGSMVAIEVEDNGKGIPKKNQNKVFKAGFTTKTRGWGLGLTLVKRIVEEYHDGRIFLKTSIVGEGTTFRVELTRKEK